MWHTSTSHLRDPPQMTEAYLHRNHAALHLRAPSNGAGAAPCKKEQPKAACSLPPASRLVLRPEKRLAATPPSCIACPTLKLTSHVD